MMRRLRILDRRSAAGMAMRLRKTHGSSQQLRPRHSLNGFFFAHAHAGRLSAIPNAPRALGLPRGDLLRQLLFHILEVAFHRDLVLQGPDLAPD